MDLDSEKGQAVSKPAFSAGGADGTKAMITAIVTIQPTEPWESEITFRAEGLHFDMLKTSIRVQAGTRVAGVEYLKASGDGRNWIIRKAGNKIGSVKITEWRFA